MDVFVCPRVRHDDVSGILLHIGEGIKQVSEFLGRDELRWVFATVDAPVTEQRVNMKPWRMVCCLTRSYKGGQYVHHLSGWESPGSLGHVELAVHVFWLLSPFLDG